MQLLKDLQGFTIFHRAGIVTEMTHLLGAARWHFNRQDLTHACPTRPCGMVRSILRQTFMFVVFARGSCHSFIHSLIQSFLQQPENSLASVMPLELTKVIKCWLIYRSGSMNKWRLQCSKEIVILHH